MNNKRTNKKLTLALDESGAAAIVIAIVLTALCGFVALGMDIGHMVMVKAELQRTADAGALAGAAGLVPYNNPGLNQTPNWVNAKLKAQAVVNNAANKANNQQFAISVDDVKLGYWCLKPPGYVQSPPSPPLPTVCPTDLTLLPEPAITVILSRDVTLYLAPLVGVSSPKSVSATATAILPEAYTTTNIPPIAVDTGTVYNNVAGNLVIDCSEEDIKIQSNKGVAGWFNQIGDNSVPSVRINTPLTTDTSLPIYNQIYLVPGTKATLTDLITEGSTIVLPIVDYVAQKVWKNIIGWAAFKVDQLDANSMQGHFVIEYFDPNVIPTAGPLPTLPSAVSGTPKLVSP